MEMVDPDLKEPALEREKTPEILLKSCPPTRMPAHERLFHGGQTPLFFVSERDL